MPQSTGRGRLVAALTALMLLAGAVAASPATTLAYGGDGLRAAANRLRADAHVPPVAGTALLDDIASHRASQLVRLDRLEHDMDYVTHRLNDAGVCWKQAGEILAWERGASDYDYRRTGQAWFDSDTHRDIMLGADYNAAGGAWRSAPHLQHYSVMVLVELCGTTTSSVSISALRPRRTYDPDRPLVLRRGRHTGYKLSAEGFVVSRRTVSYAHRATRTTSGRVYVGNTAYLKVSSGKLRGYWVRESSHTHVRGMTQYREFQSARAISVAAGRHRGHRFDWLGRVTDSRGRIYRHATLTAATARAVINGRVYLRFANGWLAGHWVRDTGHITFR
ncbi:MAG TPA: CAP domain-containing protein [Candidatus Limnocylindria bacterium]